MPTELIIREIEPSDNVTGLSLGDKKFIPLKTFLKRDAKPFHKANIAKTYCLVEPDQSPSRIWGYITLLCSEIKIENCQRPNDCANMRYDSYPAVKIARLAIDKEVKGNDLGTSLVDFSVSLVQDEIMPKIGCRFLVVDSKKDALEFYQKVGFTMLDTENNKHAEHPILFMDLHKL